MIPQVGDNIQFYCKKCRRQRHGQVTRIFEKCPPVAQDHFLVKYQGLWSDSVWITVDQVSSIISEGYSHEAWNIAEDLEINLELSEGYDDGKKKESNNS